MPSAMQIIRLLQHTLLATSEPIGLMIGNVDGVHQGHQALLKHLSDYCQNNGLKTGVLSFFPHPRECTQKRKQTLITPLHDRAFWLNHFALDYWFLKSFTPSFAHLSPREFIVDFLSKQLNVRYLLAGEDFRFGYQAQGDMHTLKQLTDEAGFTVCAHPLCYDGQKERISSSSIRALLQAGDVYQAQALLGHPLTLTGNVQHGAKRGRELKVRTLNLKAPNHWCLPNGVYVVGVNIDDHHFWGVANLGVAPTFSPSYRRLEAHVFADLPALYGKEIQVSIHHFLRAERTFSDAQALQKQIQQDIADTQQFIHQSNLNETDS